jgi:two-component system chemotaxis sensor kinase CheA
MLPIGTTFGRFKRLVRDLSSELGKEIELITDGAETELDKTVIEKLNDPLVHLIRNSIDHGIETPDVRESLNKQKVGTIRLSALHSGAHVVVRIQDDGKGLDREAILAKALEKALSCPAQMTTTKCLASSSTRILDSEGNNQCFRPGVGMDVVKKAIIDSLKGSIDIASEKGRDTVTIKLPLTLAIVEGLLVKIAEDSFVLPLSVVEECVELTKEDREKSHSGNLAHIRGEIVPYIRLRREFGMSEVLPDIEQIVVTATNGTRVGLVVDSVIGEHQTVIKNLGRMYRDVEGISGATVLGDGTVALIVDVPRLLDKMELAEAVFG